MKKIMHIEILFNEESLEENTFSSEVERVVKNEESEFYELMNRIAKNYSMRAELVEDTLEVTDVSANKNGGVVSVTFMYSAYYGCEDMNKVDYIEEEWEFRRVGNKLIFDLALPLEREPDDI